MRAFDLLVILFFGLVWVGIVWFLRIKQKKKFIYLLFFTIFFVYLFKVLDYTLLQFQSLLLLKYFMPNLMLQGQEAGNTLNVIPLVMLSSEDIKTSLLNILLFIPFGFGLPFITNFRMRKIGMVGFLVSIAIELLQLLTGLIANVTFRIADINDVIFNTLGVVIGYVCFIGFVSIFRYVSVHWKISFNPIVKYILERPQL